jgi:hypothetical protein
MTKAALEIVVADSHGGMVFGLCKNKNRLEYVYGCSFGLENVKRAQFTAQM